MSAPVETKVKAASLTSLAAGFVVGWAVLELPFLAGSAEVLQAAVVAGIGAAGSWAGGWLAKHTPRTPSRM